MYSKTYYLCFMYPLLEHSSSLACLLNNLDIKTLSEYGSFLLRIDKEIFRIISKKVKVEQELVNGGRKGCRSSSRVKSYKKKEIYPKTQSIQNSLIELCVYPSGNDLSQQSNSTSSQQKWIQLREQITSHTALPDHGDANLHQIIESIFPYYTLLRSSLSLPMLRLLSPEAQGCKDF